MAIGAFISGCAGLALTSEEETFFRDTKPWGLILFRRNVESPEQIRSLTAAFRELVGRRNAPVFIDQEGGRVQRMGPPSAFWRKYPAARRYADLYATDPTSALRKARLIARLMADDLYQVGVTANCVPVLDVPQADSHDVIGDRAFGTAPETVSLLARAVMAGMLGGGVLPVIKHIPGHGRANADSHHALPVVKTPRQMLQGIDFVPFAALADAPMAMTAHVVYDAFDREAPATQSRKVVNIIRKSIGFEGLLITDDLSMNALSGGLADRVRESQRAGCDMMLHCNGTLSEMATVAAAAGELKGRALTRARTALKQQRKPLRFDRRAALKHLEEMLLVGA
jgi:beta-N-acetylhexosaminidase